MGIFPFETSALETPADYATLRYFRGHRRYIINAINECAIQAWDEGKLLIDDATVNAVAQFVFA
ncbi:hypothetical protein [Candidatus Amarolinea dominans]|uniref:hypothetical protein n=1 Tax=Candidatus Amarolinea dominans TaxID=3140696 RepID=UPI001D586D6B|nr:hypothetical protein [Anaerolineae bacterium]